MWHGNHGLSRLLIRFARVVSRPSHFYDVDLKRGYRGCREQSVNVDDRTWTYIKLGELMT